MAVARRAHAVATEEKEQAHISLHDAMSEILERRQRAFKSLMYASGVIFGLVLAIAVITL